MKKRIDFAVILTEDKKIVLVVDNSGVYDSIADWQRRFDNVGGLVLYASTCESIDLNLSHYFLS